MSLKVTIENVKVFGSEVWGARLTGAEVRRLGEPKARGGQRSIISVTGARFVQDAGLLSFYPEHAAVLNIGSTDDALIIDIGHDASADTEPASSKDTEPAYSDTRSSEPVGSGDEAFLAECRRLLNPHLTKMGAELLQEVRSRYPGKLVEGQARKWVNDPGNFLALTIQNRDQSFAVHVKGSPNEFTAPTLDIKPDRPSYCRFKLEQEGQLQDAIKVVLGSASRTEGY